MKKEKWFDFSDLHEWIYAFFPTIVLLVAIMTLVFFLVAFPRLTTKTLEKTYIIVIISIVIAVFAFIMVDKIVEGFDHMRWYYRGCKNLPKCLKGKEDDRN